MPGRIDRTIEQPADRRGAVVADLADPEDRIDAEVIARLFRIQFAHLKDVGAVDEDDDFVELALNVLHEFDLRVVELEDVLGRIRVAGRVVRGEVVALGTAARDRDDRGVAICRIAAFRPLQSADVDFFALAVIDPFQRVVDFEAGAFQASRQRSGRDPVRTGASRAGTAAARHQIIGPVPKKGKIHFRIRKRKRAVVFQEDHAFFRKLGIELGPRFAHFFHRIVVFLELTVGRLP